MKTLIPLKEFSALSSGAVKITHENARAIPEWSPRPTPESVRDLPVQPDRSDQSVREMLDRRYTAPFPCATPYQHWGLNE